MKTSVKECLSESPKWQKPWYRDTSYLKKQPSLYILKTSLTNWERVYPKKDWKNQNLKLCIQRLISTKPLYILVPAPVWHIICTNFYVGAILDKFAANIAL